MLQREVFFSNMQCLDIIQRHAMVYANGVEATWQWVLTSPGTDLIFGKMRLIASQGEKLPRYYCFRRLLEKFRGFKKVKQVSAGREIYLFKVVKADGSFYIAWHREEGLDSYDAEMAEPIGAYLPTKFKKAKITDIYGEEAFINSNGSN